MQVLGEKRGKYAGYLNVEVFKKNHQQLLKCKFPPDYLQELKKKKKTTKAPMQGTMGNLSLRTDNKVPLLEV